MLRRAENAAMIGGSSNAEQILAKLRAQAARLSDLSVPLTQAGIVVRDAAVMRIKEQGGDQDWLPNKRGGHTGIDSGRMMSSIQVSPVAQNAVSVGTNLQYAKWFQEGTGIYAGHTPWTIKPKSKKALAFTSGGVEYVRRSVTIPGEPRRPYLLITDTEKAGIRDVFYHWINAS
jgi:phage gpG-like protein